MIARDATTADEVAREIQSQPHLLAQLAENTLTVASGLRQNYLKCTATFIADVRTKARVASRDPNVMPVLQVYPADTLTWEDVRGETVVFIDGGVGMFQFASQTPIVLRVGSYQVTTGETRLEERERFNYYPIILGNIEGCSKERKDFIDVVRITAELLAGLAALERSPELRLLMFHGPLVYLVSAYAGHEPFTEADIDLFLKQFGATPEVGRALKDAFWADAVREIYPALSRDAARWWSNQRLFDPLAFMAFLLRRLVATAQARMRRPFILGAVERSDSSEFARTVLMARVFDGLRAKGNLDYFNKMFARTDLNSADSLVRRLQYTDNFLLHFLLEPGHYTESWPMAKYHGLRRVEVAGPSDTERASVDYAALQKTRFGFPAVLGSYLRVSTLATPIRIEVFADLQDDLDAVIGRAYLYARLLPGYGFPVGLDIADKYAHVPGWMTKAYGDLIAHHLAAALYDGEVSDETLRQVLVESLYMTRRDWLFRPSASR